jgi:acyl carrier protein
MSSIEDRLIDCFRAVRPELTAEVIRCLDQRAMSEWDSMLVVTLFTVVEDEFKVQLPLADVESFLSFDALAKRLEGLPR